MSTKVDQLVAWCRISDRIPAAGTPERNDLCDLVMQRTLGPDGEIKQFYKQIRDEPDSVKRWIWLVCNVCDQDSAIALLKTTLLSYMWYQLQVEHEEDITKGWFEINTARRELDDRKRSLDEREAAMVEMQREIDTRGRIMDQQRETIYALRSENDELAEAASERDVYARALRRGMDQHQTWSVQGGYLERATLG